METNNYVYDHEMVAFPFEWDDPPEWLNWINDQFNAPDYHVHPGSFEKCLNIVQSHLHNWVTAGSWLYKIRRIKAYCYHYPNWKAFCEKALGRSTFTVGNYIRAARVFKDLAEMGFKVLPKNVSQCLPMAKLREWDLKEAWQKVIDENPPHLITNKIIDASVKGEPLATKKRVDLPLPEWEKFAERCREAGLNPQQELEKILGSYDPETGKVDIDGDSNDDEVEPVDPENVEVWKEDLRVLVEELENKYGLSRFSAAYLFCLILRINSKKLPPPE
ncbi:MAG: hypothetical protein QNJ42_14030 [Crocosphaera sp.]|nr:hypothetical protein [Crocosphaera sp.]